MIKTLNLKDINKVCVEFIQTLNDEDKQYLREQLNNGHSLYPHVAEEHGIPQEIFTAVLKGILNE